MGHKFSAVLNFHWFIIVVTLTNRVPTGQKTVSRRTASRRARVTITKIDAFYTIAKMKMGFLPYSQIYYSLKIFYLEIGYRKPLETNLSKFGVGIIFDGLLSETSPHAMSSVLMTMTFGQFLSVL